MRFLNRIWDLIILKGYRAARRRRRYDEIKAMIVEEHLKGKGGMVLPSKYDARDADSFKPPMYFQARTVKNERCIFWRKELMTEEIGPPRAKTEVQLAEATLIRAIANDGP